MAACTKYLTVLLYNVGSSSRGPVRLPGMKWANQKRPPPYRVHLLAVSSVVREQFCTSTRRDEQTMHRDSTYISQLEHHFFRTLYTRPRWAGWHEHWR